MNDTASSYPPLRVNINMQPMPREVQYCLARS